MKKKEKWHFHAPWSKLLTLATVLLVYGFVIWACAEMHRQADLTAMGYIGASVVGLLATVVSAYMWRAKQQDLFELELRKNEEMAKLRRKYGTDAQNERVAQPEDYYGGDNLAG